ncbi:putative membrane protein [Kribbella voronezhensis]|uniref:Putative membrane protein n=1 Tax=Kribbella voronezhensis TaxID=2512212 RepID=A0A4R7SXT7_9ACTN|nr:hypothetical protein [Kribbella voronezhensis]TDU83835.1 putative membrane protein [Kribbella voronezhensis]
MRYHDDWGWGWMMVVMPLLWIALTAVIVWAVLQVVHRPTGSAPTLPGRETPQEILDRRFASGEIDADTYTKAKAHLSGRDVRTP